MAYNIDQANCDAASKRAEIKACFNFTDYNLVVAANLIDRLADPARFLRDIAGRIRTGAFELIGDPVKMPFVIRETANKHQHTLSEATIWKKK